MLRRSALAQVDAALAEVSAADEADRRARPLAPGELRRWRLEGKDSFRKVCPNHNSPPYYN